MLYGMRVTKSRNFSPSIKQNIWKVVKKFKDGNACLMGCTNTMHPSMDKSKDRVAPEIFHKTVEEFTIVKIDCNIFSKVKLFYGCLNAKTISDVKVTLEGVSEVVDLTTSTPK